MQVYILLLGVTHLTLGKRGGWVILKTKYPASLPLPNRFMCMTTVKKSTHM